MTIQATSALPAGLTARSLGPGLGAPAGALPLIANRGPSSSAPTLGNDTPELKTAFNDFVGQSFFGELLKQMRSTVGKPAYLHGGLGEDVFQSQLDQILVERISDASAATFSDPMYQLMLARRP
jgi:peptidoglycan hydrolase FlgJ